MALKKGWMKKQLELAEIQSKNYGYEQIIEARKDAKVSEKKPEIRVGLHEQ